MTLDAALKLPSTGCTGKENASLSEKSRGFQAAGQLKGVPERQGSRRATVRYRLSGSAGILFESMKLAGSAGKLPFQNFGETVQWRYSL